VRTYILTLIPHRFCPWQKHIPYKIVLSKLSKDQEAQAHTAYMTTQLGDSLLAIYSDASSVEDGAGTRVRLAAFDYAQSAREVFSRTLNTGKGQIVYNGELEGITQAFEYAARVAHSSRKFEYMQTTKLLSTDYRPPQTIQLKLDHGYNKAYLFRIGKAVSPCCSCGA
jgi:hypothetical protein